jgi:hypothetical protein
VIIDIKGDVICEALDLFARAPGSSKETIDVGPEHRAGVIERKHRIKAFVPKLALSCHGSPSTWNSNVSPAREVLSNPHRIVRILIGGHLTGL